MLNQNTENPANDWQWDRVKKVRNMLENFRSIPEKPVNFVNLKPYIYSPHYAITDHNQQSIVVPQMKVRSFPNSMS